MTGPNVKPLSLAAAHEVTKLAYKAAISACNARGDTKKAEELAEELRKIELKGPFR